MKVIYVHIPLLLHVANLLRILSLYQGIPSMDLMASPCFGGILIVIPASWSTFSFLSSLRHLSSSLKQDVRILDTSTQEGSCHLKLMNMVIACASTELQERCSWCGYVNQIQWRYDKISVEFKMLIYTYTYSPSCWNLYAVLLTIALSILCKNLLTSCISCRWTVVQ